MRNEIWTHAAHGDFANGKLIITSVINGVIVLQWDRWYKLENAASGDLSRYPADMYPSHPGGFSI